MAAEIRAESRELLVLVALTTLPDQVGMRVVGRAGTAATNVEDAEPLALLLLPPLQAARTLAPARRPTQARAVRERPRKRRLTDDSLPVLGMVASLIVGCRFLAALRGPDDVDSGC